MIVPLIPLFLAARLPIEDGTWQYGPEYIFTVQMNMTRTPESTGVPSESRVTSRLYCVPKIDDALICSLKNGNSLDFGSHGRVNDIANWRKNITDAPMELFFAETGVYKMMVSQQAQTYDLNILRTVLEQLHTGLNFSDIEYGTVDRMAWSIVAQCNTTIDVSRQTTRPTGNTAKTRDFELELLLPQLRKNPGETIVIDKTPNLNNCSCFVDNYYRKFGDTIVCTSGVKADLESMTSRMEISDASFVSLTTRKGSVETDDENYNVVETTKLILDEIRPAAREPPTIVNPGKTALLANYDVTSSSD